MHIEYSCFADETIQQFVLYGMENFGERVALAHYHKLKAKINQLRKFPEMGFPEPSLKNKSNIYRTFVFEKRYKVIYHVEYEKGKVIIDDFWDLKKQPSTLIRRIK